MLWPVCAEGLLLYTQQQHYLLLPCEYPGTKTGDLRKGNRGQEQQTTGLQRFHTGWGKVTTLSKELHTVPGPGMESVKQTPFELSKRGPGDSGMIR